MGIMRFCPKCGNIKSDRKCFYCGTVMVDTDLSDDEFIFEMGTEQTVLWKRKIMDTLVKSNPQFSEQALDKRLTAEYSGNNTKQHQPKCPTCGSTNIQKIGGIERGVSVGILGLFSKKINKSFKCSHCGYTW